MTKYEILKMNERLFSILLNNKINPNDIRYLPIYEKFLEMKSKGHKVGYIVVYLASEHKMTDRGIYKIIGRFESKVLVKETPQCNDSPAR